MNKSPETEPVAADQSPRGDSPRQRLAGRSRIRRRQRPLGRRREGELRVPPARRENSAPQDIALLDEIAETILPATKTPGAKAAKTGAFMALMVTDCYSPAEQQVFRDGMRKVDEAMKKAHGISFMAATPAQRLAVLTDARPGAEARDGRTRSGGSQAQGARAVARCAGGGGGRNGGSGDRRALHITFA